MDDYDVVVAGGGPAGCAAALTLARSGFRLLMAEAGGSAEFRVGEGLPPHARSLLEELKVWERTLADGHRSSFGTLSSWGTADLQPHDFIFQLHGSGLQLDRSRFDRMLRLSATEAGVKVCECARVRIAAEQALTTEGWYQLRLGAAGSEFSIRCRWLIDATGRPAAIARSLGATRVRTDALVAIYVKVAPAEPGVDEQSSTLVEAVEDGWWYTVLLPSGERLIVFLGDRDIIDRHALLTTEGFLLRMRRARHVCERATLHPQPTSAPHGADACSSRLDPAAGDHWMAVGDAALAFDPLSSKGISNALYTGVRGARAIVAVEAGDLQACAKFQQHLDDIFAAYRIHLRHYYAFEQRWPHMPFWQRRASSSSLSPANCALKSSNDL